jgi:hypothetical protein
VTAIPATSAPGIALHDSKIVLRAANGIPLKVVGAFHARISLQQNSADEIVYVVRGLSRPLLSRTTMKELGLIHPDFPFQDLAHAHTLQSFHAKPTTSGSEPQTHVQVPSPPSKQDLIVTDHGSTFDRLFNEYADLFDGCCTEMKSADYSIEVEKDVKPVSYGACRSVPDPYLPALQRELDSLVEQGIIEPITYSTPWLHPIM